MIKNITMEEKPLISLISLFEKGVKFWSVIKWWQEYKVQIIAFFQAYMKKITTRSESALGL